MCIIINPKPITMKNVLFILLFTLCVVVHASEPRYDVGDENVKVFMADLDEPIALIATINLFDAEVVMEPARAETVTAHVIDATLNTYMVAIKTETKEKHYVYISERIKYQYSKIKKPIKIPKINNRNLKTNFRKLNPQLHLV